MARLVCLLALALASCAHALRVGVAAQQSVTQHHTSSRRHLLAAASATCAAMLSAPASPARAAAAAAPAISASRQLSIGQYLGDVREARLALDALRPLLQRDDDAGFESVRHSRAFPAPFPRLFPPALSTQKSPSCRVLSNKGRTFPPESGGGSLCPSYFSKAKSFPP